MKLGAVAFALILASIVFFSSQPSSAVEITDGLGRKVMTPDAPARIVSLAPSLTELVFALGMGDKLVGVTEYCNFPAAAASVPRVGSYADPGLEGIVSVMPDLVLASADSTKPSLVAGLEKLSIPVVVVNPRSLKNTLETFVLAGRACGVEERGRALADELTTTIETYSTKRDTAKPSILLCVMVKPLVVAGPDTLADDLIRVVGGANVVGDSPTRFPNWSMESVLQSDPDVIIVSPHPGEDDPAALFTNWPELAAVRTDRVVIIDPDWIHRPGPRLGLGIEALAGAIGKVGGIGR